MTLVETDEVAGLAADGDAGAAGGVPDPRQRQVLLCRRTAKHFVKGVTYGPFATGSHGAPFPERAMVEHDFALMSETGINTVRVFTVPPVWLLDAAHAAGLKVLVGLPWPQHVTFLDSPAIQAEIQGRGRSTGCAVAARHPAIFAYLVGNEIPPDMIRWHGAEPVRAISARPRRPGQATSTRERWSATPTFRRPNI